MLALRRFWRQTLWPCYFPPSCHFRSWASALCALPRRCFASRDIFAHFLPVPRPATAAMLAGFMTRMIYAALRFIISFASFHISLHLHTINYSYWAALCSCLRHYARLFTAYISFIRALMSARIAIFYASAWFNYDDDFAYLHAIAGAASLRSHCFTLPLIFSDFARQRHYYMRLYCRFREMAAFDISCRGSAFCHFTQCPLLLVCFISLHA